MNINYLTGRKEDMVSEENITPMLTVREVARLLHIHNNTVRRWADHGIIRSYRITTRGDRRFKKQDIIDFIGKLNGDQAADGDHKSDHIA